MEGFFHAKSKHNHFRKTVYYSPIKTDPLHTGYNGHNLPYSYGRKHTPRWTWKAFQRRSWCISPGWPCLRCRRHTSKVHWNERFGTAPPFHHILRRRKPVSSKTQGAAQSIQFQIPILYQIPWPAAGKKEYETADSPRKQ